MFPPVWNLRPRRLWIFYVFSCLESSSEKTLDFYVFPCLESPSEKTLDFYVFLCLKSPSEKTLNIFQIIPFWTSGLEILNTFEKLFGIPVSEDFEYFWENICLESQSEKTLVNFWTLVRLSDYICLFRPLSESWSLSEIFDPCPSPYFGGVVRVLRGGVTVKL